MENETLFDYHKRLVYGKLVDKTLADLDYTEIAERIYGKPYASDVARRMLYGSLRTLEQLNEENINSVKDEKVISEIDAKIIDLKKEQKRFYDQRREFNKIVAQDGRREHLYESLIRAAESLKDTIGCVYDRDEPDDDYILSTSDTEAVLVLNDWHYGMTTDNIFNEYNTEICKRRVKYLTARVTERLDKHKCSILHIVVLGDMIHGAIHTSARVASNELVCDQLMQVSELLAQTILHLSKFTNEVYVYTTYGNHARTVQNKQDNIHRDNMERIIPWWLEQRLSGSKNIYIVDDSKTEFLLFNVAGHDFCATHGDLDTVKNSPRLFSSLFNRMGANIEYILLGDKHHVEEVEDVGVQAKLCGALCGSDDYANERRLYSLPSQLMMIVDPELGVDAEYKIKLNHKDLG